MVRNGLLHRIKVGIGTFYKQYIANLDRKKYGFIAEDVKLLPPIIVSHPENVFLYSDTVLNRAIIFADSAKFIMKPHSLTAEGLRVSTGNHAMIIGRFCTSIKQEEKPVTNIQDVIVESDVWIGRNVTLLPGVHIGRGCTIGAGAVVNKSTPPYCLVAGVPARPIKFKWTIDEILRHEEQLYPVDERFSREILEEIFANAPLKNKG